jgi:hypothetical protein
VTVRPMARCELPLGQPLHPTEVRQLAERVLSGAGFVLHELGEGAFRLITPAPDGSWHSVALCHPDGATRTTITRAEVLGYLLQDSPG